MLRHIIRAEVEGVAGRLFSIVLGMGAVFGGEVSGLGLSSCPPGILLFFFLGISSRLNIIPRSAAGGGGKEIFEVLDKMVVISTMHYFEALFTCQRYTVPR